MKTEASLKVTSRSKKSENFKYDRREDGWKIIEDVEFLYESKFKLRDFLQEKEDFAVDSGDAVLARVKKIGNRAGQLHAEMLLDRQEDIPKEWRRYDLVFFGTVWYSPDGYRYVPYLHCRDDNEWYLYFHVLNSEYGRDQFDGCDQSVHISK